jgi:hypothetical protein
LIYRLSADLVLLVHLGFVLFVVLGGLLVLRWRWLMWLHLPAVIWGAAIEFGGWTCPLTPLEVTLRRLGGEAGYEGDFIDHYATALLYPGWLTPAAQIWLGVAALLPNVLIYGYLLRRSRIRRRRMVRTM